MDKEKAKIGKRAYLTMKCSHVKGISVVVQILDVKFSYGTYRYKVTPIEGTGQIWVQKLTIIK